MVGVEVCLYGGVGHFNVWGLGEDKRRPFALEAPLVVETFYLFLGVDMDGISREIFPDAVHYAIH